MTTEIISQTEVPTGHILVIKGDKGPIELVSLGDYGKDINLNENIKVEDHYPLLPLTDKWVITISTQYGCSMGCKFCDVPKVGPGKNCSLIDLQNQVIAGLQTHPDVTYSNRLNIHYARMGEPTFNPAVLDHAKWMKTHIDPEYNVHPVLTSMMPRKNKWLKTFIHNWIRIKNRVYFGNAGLQISLNSTNEDQRNDMFSGNALSIKDIAKIFDDTLPVGRKFTLNFPVAGWDIEPDVLKYYFDTERFLVKLTPMHKTKTSGENGIETSGDYTNPDAYKLIAQGLKDEGFDVLVFIASEDEDHGMITCGNAILAGQKQPRLRDGTLRFMGGSAVGENKFMKWDERQDVYQLNLKENLVG